MSFAADTSVPVEKSRTEIEPNPLWNRTRFFFIFDCVSF